MNNDNYNTNNTFTLLLLNRINEYFDSNHMNDKIYKLTNILEGKSNLSLRIIDWFVTNYSKKYNVSYIIKKNTLKNTNEIIYTYDDDKNVDNKYSLTIPFDDITKTDNIDNMIYNNLVNNLHNNEYIYENEIDNTDPNTKYVKFIVFNEYRGQLKAFTKKYFDSFCRGERMTYSYNDDIQNDKNNKKYKFETTLGQLNFFRWAIENELLTYIENNFEKIQNDMNENIKKKKINKSVHKMKEQILSNSKDIKICNKLKYDHNIMVPFIKENQKIVVKFN